VKFLLHKLTASTVSVLVILVLVIGCGAACAQPLMAKSKHSCCHSKDSCKSQQSEMKSGACERDALTVPQTASVPVDLVGTPLNNSGTDILAPASAGSFIHIAPPQQLIPLRI
jgi:hypothetical protein